MKKFLIKGLRFTRKFGFIMSAIMLFPYLSGVPSVMASEEQSVPEEYEVSLDELEKEYETIQSELDYDQRMIEELEQYILVSYDGTLSLNIPSNVVVNVTTEEIERIESQLDFINNGDFLVEQDDGHIFIHQKNHDEQFVVQANSIDFSVRWYGNRIRLSFAIMEAIYEEIESAINTIKYYSNAVKTAVVTAVLGALVAINGGFWSFLSNVLGSLGTVGVAMYTIMHDIFLAIKAIFSNVYVIVTVIVLSLSAWYNYTKLKTAGTNWTKGTEIRLYGLYFITGNTSAWLFPGYREQ